MKTGSRKVNRQRSLLIALAAALVVQIALLAAPAPPSYALQARQPGSGQLLQVQELCDDNQCG